MVDLKETNIQDLKNFDWVAYFIIEENRHFQTLKKYKDHMSLQVVWMKYKGLFVKGGYSKKQFQLDSLSYLNQSIQIEKNGKLL